MEKISVHEALEHTKDITDVRIKEADHLITVIVDYMGQLADNVLGVKDIKTSAGYILIYLIALTKVLNHSFKDCFEQAYSKLKKNKEIIFDRIM